MCFDSFFSFVWSGRVWSHRCFIPSFSFSLSHTHTHTQKGQSSGFLNLTRSLALPVWAEFNRVLWCERDVSLKNIRHQRSLLRWSGISSCAHSAHSLELVSFFDAARQFQSVGRQKEKSEFGIHIIQNSNRQLCKVISMMMMAGVDETFYRRNTPKQMSPTGKCL